MTKHLIGVIDVRDGKAVHAVAGQRGQYQVIDQPWCEGGDLLQLSISYQPYVTGLYIADLDAITDCSQRSVAAIENLVNARSLHPIWLDAGWGRESWRPNYEHILGKVRIVVGTETLVGLEALRTLVEIARSHETSVILSLDLRAGRMVAVGDELNQLGPLKIIKRALEVGVAGVIILDLANVGVEQGPGSHSIIARIKQFSNEYLTHQSRSVEIISGGGVRGTDDAAGLLKSGCDRVLVATWLHRQIATFVK